MSRTELIQDPEAVRIRDQIRRDREVAGCPNGDGTAEIWGRIDLAALSCRCEQPECQPTRNAASRCPPDAAHDESAPC